MHYVYVIQSERCDYIYVGNTRDLENRLDEHNQGKIIATKRFAPFRLVYYEAYLDSKDAFAREIKLKHHGSVIGHLKKRLVNSLFKLPKRAGFNSQTSLTA